MIRVHEVNPIAQDSGKSKYAGGPDKRNDLQVGVTNLCFDLRLMIRLVCVLIE
jgi:hypothetical protein